MYDEINYNKISVFIHAHGECVIAYLSLVYFRYLTSKIHSHNISFPSTPDSKEWVVFRL